METSVAVLEVKYWVNVWSTISNPNSTSKTKTYTYTHTHKLHMYLLQNYLQQQKLETIQKSINRGADKQNGMLLSH